MANEAQNDASKADAAKAKADEDAKAKADAAKAKADEDAKAKADAAKAKAAASKAAPTHARVRIRARAMASFRRAGITFGPQPTDLPLAQLKPEQLEALKNAPALVVELVTLPT